MVEKISSEQSYLNYVMKMLPDTKKGAVHTVKSGENLWNIAKKELNKKNAKKNEINDYMLAIAKLNNLNTIEKMNDLKVSQKIYLPAAGTVSSATNTTRVQTPNINKAPAPAANTKAVVSQPPSTEAEYSIVKLKQIISQGNVQVEKMYKGYPSDNDLYHVYTKPKNYQTSKKHLMSFVINNKTNQITSVYFDNQKHDITPGKKDYQMDEKGIIKTNKLINPKKEGYMNSAELKEFQTVLKALAKSM